ncbi:MAG: hypothetical protein QNK05_13115 [Myxococcota bacterium]|nr:hypothetical protein [Myxococcota bacterium]
MSRRPLRAIPVALLATGIVACGSPTWHVPDGRAPKFSRDRKVCHQLTDDVEGRERAERHEACMKRRGWRHKRFWDNWNFRW